MSISWLWGSHTVKFHHASNSVSIPLKKNSIPNGEDAKIQPQTYTTLASLCQQSTPPCKLNPFLFNGHLHTMATAIKDRPLPLHYRRKVFESTDPDYPGSFSVDFVSHTPVEEPDITLHPRSSHYTKPEWSKIAKGSEDSTPMLVALHGLSGGSHELYVREVIAPLVHLGKELGDESDGTRWEACVVNSRGCARSKITSGILFNARSTWDVRQTVRWLRKTYPNRPLFGVGFSLGANILTNYLGEEGINCGMQAAVIVSNPWSLEASHLALKRSWLGLEVYSKSMGANMKKLFAKHKEDIAKYSDIDVEAVKKIKYLYEFDRVVQCPTWGYPTEGAYYRDASSVDSLLGIQIPVLIIHALDDPVTVAEGLPWEEVLMNPYAVLCTTSTGGHLGWFELGGGRWFVKPITNFFRTLADNVDLPALRSQLVPMNTHGPAVGPNPPTYHPIGSKLYAKNSSS